MERMEQCQIYIARLVLEADTALSINTGNPDGVFDTALVRDANGLPAIPGTSLAGVLRHLWRGEYGDDDSLFGYQSGNEGTVSRLSVSWGALLDSHGQPAEGLIFDDNRLQDPLYSAVLQQINAPVYRDRVRLGHKGAALDQGKFDRSVLPAGHRFAIEFRLWAPTGDSGTQWQQLLALLAHPGLRLGGATRAGYGHMKLISVHQGRFDLTQTVAREAFLSLGRGLADIEGLDYFQRRSEIQSGWYTGVLQLEAKGLWRIGQGDAPLERVEKPADLLPKTEERVVWSGGRGMRKMNLLLLPGSSLKGALAHRMAFHARRLSGQWTSDLSDNKRPEAVDGLLGVLKDKEESGHAGALYIDDGWLVVDASTITQLMHIAIDRFTGGVRNRVLYEEESLLGGKLNIHISLNSHHVRGDESLIKQAFDEALIDLCRGRLALGSRTTTGNGFFDGTLQGNLNEWLNTENTTKEVA